MARIDLGTTTICGETKAPTCRVPSLGREGKSHHDHHVPQPVYE